MRPGVTMCVVAVDEIVSDAWVLRILRERPSSGDNPALTLLDSAKPFTEDSRLNPVRLFYASFPVTRAWRAVRGRIWC
jgi:hypothetical protein